MTQALMLDGVGTEVVDERAPASSPSVARPRVRADCEDGERPCPWVSCIYHLFLDVSADGTVTLNFPGLEVWELPETCALDVAGLGGQKLEELGALLHVSGERIRQIEVAAGAKLASGLASFVEGDRRRRRRLPLLGEDESAPA
jgi:hypothetical protein